MSKVYCIRVRGKMSRLTDLILNMSGDKNAHDIRNKICLHISDLTIDASDIERKLIHNAYQQWIKYYVDKKNYTVLEAQDLAYKNLGGEY